MKKTTLIDHSRVEIVQEENNMPLKNYKDLDLKPEKATQEELEQLRRKYRVSDLFDTSSREFLRKQEEKKSGKNV